MQFTTTDHKIAAPDFFVSRPARGRADWDGVNATETLSTFVFDQKVLPMEGGQQFLYLRKPLQLKVDPARLTFQIAEWGIEMECFKLTELPRVVGRRFLRLLSAAENESLSEADQAEWVVICDYVDFTRFSIERSLPRYMEGVLVGRDQLVIVEWHDGSRETLEWEVGKALSDVEPGERFSAFVKLGKDDRAMNLRNVSLLEATEAQDGWDWESWPKKV